MIIVRSIKPGKPFQSSIFREEIGAAMNEVRKGALADFQATTRTWDHKPTFSSKTLGAGTASAQVQVATDDAVYAYVDEGTKPHIIRPRKKHALAFRGGKYRAKTKPHFIGSTGGGARGKTIVRPVVHHPGTKAREFDKTIAKKWTPELQRVVKNALARAARRSGYGVA